MMTPVVAGVSRVLIMGLAVNNALGANDGLVDDFG